MTTEPVSETPYRRILFCTDFSENADHAFDYALDAALRRPGCALFLLHVVPEPDAQFWKTYLYEVEGVDDKAKRDIDARVAETYRPRIPEGVDFRVEMRVGRDYQMILAFAAEVHADLIVMGRHGHSALESVLFGNVTEKVVRKAACPVLVVPPEPRKTS
ncbi:MAG TPA: universal stress protein [Candidatus Hydrogenedentes bacterium]|nr:universal stress protein [Candidatus Hydrogenedentota bacterium]